MIDFAFITRSELIFGRREFKNFLKTNGLRSDEVSVPEHRMRFINSCDTCAKISFFVISAFESFWHEFPLNQRENDALDHPASYWVVSSNKILKNIQPKFFRAIPIGMDSALPIYWWFCGDFVSDSDSAIELPLNSFLISAKPSPSTMLLTLEARLWWRLSSVIEIPDFHLSEQFFKKERAFALDVGDVSKSAIDHVEIPKSILFPINFGGILRQSGGAWPCYWSQADSGGDRVLLYILCTEEFQPLTNSEFSIARSISSSDEKTIAQGFFD